MKNSILMLFWTFSCCFCDGDVLICRGVLCSVCVCVCRCQRGHRPWGLCEPFHSSGAELRPAAAGGHPDSSSGERERLLHLHHRLISAQLLRLFSQYPVPAESAYPGHEPGHHQRPGETLVFTKVIFVWLRIVKSWCLGGIKPTSVLFVCSVRSWSQRAKRASPNLKISQRRSGWWWTICSVMPKNRSLYIFVMHPLSSPP